MLDRKLWREMYRTKGLLLAITSIIAVGVTCFVAMQSAYENLSRAKADYYRQSRMADFWVQLKKVPLAEVAAASQLPGVAQLQARIHFPATVDMEHVLEPLNATVISLPDQPRPTINGIVMRQGSYFSNRQSNEVIVSDAFARRHKLFPGGKLHLLLNNRRQELLIVGTAISSEYTYMLGPGALLPDPEHFGVFYIKRQFAEDVYDFSGAANQIVGRFSPGAARDGDQILERLKHRLRHYGVVSTTPLRRQASNQFLSAEIDGLGAFATVVPTIFLVVAAVVLNVLITRLARQQRTEVGTLKALGYTDERLFFHFLEFGLVVGITGGLLGSLLGYAASTGMTAIYHDFFEFPELRSGFYWYTHAIALSVSMFCAVVGSLHGAWGILRLQPAAAMRSEPPRRGGAVWLEQIPGLWASLSAAWRIALRSLLRSRVRSAAGVFASLTGAALLVTGFMLSESQVFLIDFQLFQVVRSDIDLSLADERGRDAWEEVRRLPGVDWAEPVLAVACTLSHGPYSREGGITGLLPDARLTIPRTADGQRIALPEEGLVMSRALAELLHVVPGQRVRVEPVVGQRREVEALVAAVADSYMGLEVYADIHYLSRLIEEPFAMNGAQLLIDPRPESRRQLFQSLKQLPGVRGVTERQVQIRNLVDTLIANQWVFISLLILFAGIVFFGSILNASLVNLAERQREVATFLALGYTPWEVGGIFLRETLVTSLTGTLLGLPAGYGLTLLTAQSYDNELLRLPVVSSTWIWLTTVVLAIVFSLAAHAVVQRTLLRLDCLEALKVQE